jgi:Holliday junction resolvase RusA-like endonuclease
MVVQNDAYKQYEQQAGWFLSRKPSEPISVPVQVKCLFYRKNAIRCDLTNLLEAVDDILVKYKILADDNFKIIYSHDGSRVFVDNDNPRTEIVIEDIRSYNL